jgi:hypothetical protein
MELAVEEQEELLEVLSVVYVVAIYHSPFLISPCLSKFDMSPQK